MWAAPCCAACAYEACRTAVGSIGRRSARIAYCGLFALFLFASWALREVAVRLLTTSTRRRTASGSRPTLCSVRSPTRRAPPASATSSSSPSSLSSYHGRAKGPEGLP
ncbi:hypothetical protein U9M48_032022 [Paspalum notatum var. saurae]|uniref:Uncharacterized protein n=1 Tax=Paspalum notatum var. saurae TaxID=547442 RepID=A0AAQ3X5B9_PASNO